MTGRERTERRELFAAWLVEEYRLKVEPAHTDGSDWTTWNVSLPNGWIWLGQSNMSWAESIVAAVGCFLGPQP
jgi:hypothetical protein